MKFSFSTEVVDLDNQYPNRNKRESKYFWDEMNHLISAGGFRQIAFPYEPKWDFGGRSGIPRTQRSIDVKFGGVAGYLAFLKENGIDGITSIHLNPNLFCQGALPMYFGAAAHYAEEAIAFGKEAGAESVVLSVTPTVYAYEKTKGDASEEQFLAQTADMVKKLADEAQAAGLKLCLKNEYWTLLRGERITDFLKPLPDNVYLDVDTANLYAAGADVDKVICDNAGRIGSVTLTDTAFVDDQEAYKQVMPEFPAKRATKVFRDLGDGVLDLKKYAKEAEEAGFTGTFTINCRNSYNICRSILRARYYVDHVLEG